MKAELLSFRERALEFCVPCDPHSAAFSIAFQIADMPGKEQVTRKLQIDRIFS